MSPSHDAFRHGGLGKSSEEILESLQVQPGTAAEIAAQTGRSQATVKRWLDRMASLTDPLTGAYMPLVERAEDGQWHPLAVDLDQVARALGTSGKGERQRAQFLRERSAYRRGLLLGKQEQNAGQPSGDREEM